ncbi:MAG TPA: hypothetical protein VGU44_01725, partial [Gammaproteobacteria bacterium]|nr:hypothetical protein [Gammaproteobacteria bacterium]
VNAPPMLPQQNQVSVANATKPILLEKAVIDKINEIPDVKKHGQLSVTNNVPSFTGENPLAALRACGNKELLNANYHVELPAPKTLADAKKEIAEARNGANGAPVINITTCKVGGKTYDVNPDPKAVELLTEQKASPRPRSYTPK